MKNQILMALGVAIVASVLVTGLASSIYAQSNMTGNMTGGNMTGGNMTTTSDGGGDGSDDGSGDDDGEDGDNEGEDEGGEGNN